MNCVVTAGPTWEPLDRVRRLTNFSTGGLGSELANRLVDAGHHVLLLRGEGSTDARPLQAQEIQGFATTADLWARFEALPSRPIDAVFHAAAVSDFSPGRAWHRGPGGHLVEQSAGKLSSTAGDWLVELRSTPKIIGRLRDLFPAARIVGWKYEVDGDRVAALNRGKEQLLSCRTDACVVNGPAYGAGFAWVANSGDRHLADKEALFGQIVDLLGVGPAR
jgi:phosphopantothenoylcysteine synthetase/decarboxylase